MSINTYRDLSRKQLGNLEGEDVLLAHVSTGSLQRIADAVENMADGFKAMLKERDDHKEWRGRYCEWWHEEQRKVSIRDRSISHLRGQITKLKKRLTEREAE